MTKKIIIFFTFFFIWFLFINQAFAWNFIYSSWSNIYKKSDWDSNIWTLLYSNVPWNDQNQYAIDWSWTYIYFRVYWDWNFYKIKSDWTSTWFTYLWNWWGISPNSFNISVSPDWQYIVYSYWQWTYPLYKKSTLDTWNWSQIIDWINYSPAYSRDWLYIAYRSSWTRNWYIYKKNSNDTSVWTALTWDYKNKQIKFSPDWLYIYYSNPNTDQIFKKSSTVNEYWTPIVTQVFSDEAFDISPDWLYMIYKHSSGYLYKKSTLDNSIGTSLWITWFNPLYLITEPETCFDWIKNQDETWIDVWWVCSTNSFWYTWTGFTWNNIQCKTVAYMNPNQSPTRYTDFGDMSPTPYWDWLWETTWPLALNWNWDIGYQDSTNNGLNTDYFRGIYFWTESYLPHGAMKFNSWTGANVDYQSSRTGSLSPTNPRIRIIRKRNWDLSNFNILQCSGNAWNGGCDYATLWDYINWIAVEKISKYDQKVCSMDSSSGSTTCTIIYNQTWNYTDLTIRSGFSGMRFGNIWTGTVNKVECSNDSYACRWENYWTWFFCNWHTGYNPETWTIVWECAIDSNWYCGPTDNFRSPWFWEENILDWSGNIVWIWPAKKPSWKAVVNDLFSCPEYKSWLDTPSCILVITKNLYNWLKDWLWIVGDEASTWPRKIVNTMWSGTSDFSRNFATGTTFDQKIINGAWNTGWDSNNPFSRIFIGALISVVFLAIITIIIFITLITPNKK